MKTSASIGGVVAVVVVVVGLMLAGVIPGIHLGASSSSGPSFGPPETSGLAIPAAHSMAVTRASGSLYGIFGLSSTTALSVNLSTMGSCTIHDGLSHNVTIDANGGNYSNGGAIAWIFVYYSPSNSTVSFIAVGGTHATFFGSYSGSGCVGSLPNLSPLPSTFSNSSAAAAAVDAYGGGMGAFVAGHAQANAEYTLIASNSTSAPPVWRVLFTTCPVGPVSSSGSGINATAFVNAEDASAPPMTTSVSASLSCASGGNPLPDIGPASYLSLSVFGAGSDPPGYYVNFNAVNASTADFGLLVANASAGETSQATGTVPLTCSPGAVANESNCPAISSGHFWYAFVDHSGSVVATYGGADAQWTYASGVTSVSLVSGYQLIVISDDLFDSTGNYITPFGTSGGTGIYFVVGAAAL